MTNCKHTTTSFGSSRPFTGSVNPRDENPAAHGDRTYTETCTCGASREINNNGLHQEIGAWKRS